MYSLIEGSSNAVVCPSSEMCFLLSDLGNVSLCPWQCVFFTVLQIFFFLLHTLLHVSLYWKLASSFPNSFSLIQLHEEVKNSQDPSLFFPLCVSFQYKYRRWLMQFGFCAFTVTAICFKNKTKTSLGRALACFHLYCNNRIVLSIKCFQVCFCANTISFSY